MLFKHHFISEEGLPKAKECTQQYLPKENEACASLIAELTPNDMEKGEIGWIYVYMRAGTELTFKLRWRSYRVF